MTDDTTPGIDHEAVSAWLASHVDGCTPPVGFDLIAAGGSNLTYRVTDAAGRTWALRRPPVTAVLATAHDMGREWRIIEALGAHTDVPVPAAIARCEDVEVTGAPFYVMSFVDGLILRDEAAAKVLQGDEFETATDSLIDVQLGFHTVDLDAIGLSDLARNRTGYVERQLHRWMTQVERARVRELPLLDDLHARLARTVPAEQSAPALAHGDYRFDNCVLGTDRRVAAVLDWELCTIGDPVADFCWSLMYWSDPGDAVPFLDSAPTLAPGFPRRAEVAARYEQRSGRSLDALPWFTAFSYWKMGCIVEGVYARRLKGARGGATERDVDSIAARADAFLARAAAAADGVC
jgi:aminoglycoside phosphotransferase (APT) family kinase protein